jgi:hypothetical protein
MTLAAASALAATPEGSAAPAAKKAAPATRAAAAAKATPAAKVAPAAAADGPLTPVTTMTAAQIIEKNIAARGGLAAWRAVNAMTMSGQLDAGGKQNTQLPFVMTMKRPHKNRLEVKVKEQTAVQVYDGKEGWKVRPFLNRDEVEPYTAEEAKAAASASELDGPLVDYASKGTKVELVGAQAVEGKNAYKLKLTPKEGTQRHLWVDAKSFLEVKIEGEPRRLDGKLRNVAIYYRDYKQEKGLRVPTVLETVVEGVKQSHKINIETVAVNPPVDDALFAKPRLVATVASR